MKMKRYSPTSICCLSQLFTWGPRETSRQISD